MANLIPSVLSLLGLVAACAATLLTGLVLRDPHAPGWLKSEGVATGAALVLTALVLVAMTYAASELTAAKLHYALVACVIAAVLVGATWALWAVLDLGDRFARAEAGHSPFARPMSLPALQSA